MQVTYVGHACILVEGDGVRLIMDPWLVDPAYRNTWYDYPPLVHTPADLFPVDYVYCSHEHPDHFDPPTLERLPKDQKILLPEFTSGVLTERFERLGFTNFVKMPFGERLELAPDFRVTCLRSDLVWEDSAIIVESGGTTLFNMNDCKLGDGLLRDVGERYRPDIAFIPFSGAIHFPTCYEYTREQRAELCAARQRKHLEGFAERAKLLQAPRAVPFAGNFGFLAEDQLWMNEKSQNNITTPDEAVTTLQSMAPDIEPVQINPGDTWSLADGVTRKFPAPDFTRREEQLREMAERERPRLEALRVQEAPARASLCDDFRAYFSRIAAAHPELCERISARIVMSAEGENGGTWCLDYQAGGLEVSDFEDGQPWNMRLDLPAGILQRVIDDEICWDEVCISFRVRFRENPEFFNQDFWAMLYNSSEAFLDEYLSKTDPKFR